MPSNGLGKEPARVPAKDISLGMVLSLLRKHRLCMVVTPLLVTIAAVIYAVQEPTRYRAEALLAAEPTTIEGYVSPRGNVSPINVQEKLWLVRENLFSPTVLEPLIQEFHLENRDDTETQIQLLAEKTLRSLSFHRSGDKTGGISEQNQEEPTIDELKKIEDLKKGSPSRLRLPTLSRLGLRETTGSRQWRWPTVWQIR